MKTETDWALVDEIGRVLDIVEGVRTEREHPERGLHVWIVRSYDPKTIRESLRALEDLYHDHIAGQGERIKNPRGMLYRMISTRAMRCVDDYGPIRSQHTYDGIHGALQEGRGTTICDLPFVQRAGLATCADCGWRSAKTFVSVTGRAICPGCAKMGEAALKAWWGFEAKCACCGEKTTHGLGSTIGETYLCEPCARVVEEERAISKVNAAAVRKAWRSRKHGKEAETVSDLWLPCGI